MTAANRVRAALLVCCALAAAGCDYVSHSVAEPSAVVVEQPSVSARPLTNSPRSHSPAPSFRPSPSPTPVPPPRPSGVSFHERRKGDDAELTKITQTVKWAAPASEGVEIRVYGVTECIARPAKPSPDTHGPCLVEHTPLPASVRKLLATAPASDGVVSWTWTGTFDCDEGMAYDPRGLAYYAVVLAAYSTSGHSTFAIAEPGGWWQPGPDDIIC